MPTTKKIKPDEKNQKNIDLLEQQQIDLSDSKKVADVSKVENKKQKIARSSV